METRVNRSCLGWCGQVRAALGTLGGATGLASRGDAVRLGWHWWAGAARMKPKQCSQPEGMLRSTRGGLWSTQGGYGQLEELRSTRGSEERSD